MTELLCSDNSFGDVGCFALCQSLPTITTLKNLHVRSEFTTLSLLSFSEHEGLDLLPLSASAFDNVNLHNIAVNMKGVQSAFQFLCCLTVLETGKYVCPCICCSIVFTVLKIKVPIIVHSPADEQADVQLHFFYCCWMLSLVLCSREARLPSIAAS